MKLCGYTEKLPNSLLFHDHTAFPRIWKYY